MLTLLLLVGIQPLPAASQDKILEERVFLNEMTRSILISPDQFTPEDLNQRFASFISETEARFRVARLEIYAGTDDPRGTNCKCSYDVTYGF